MDLSACVYEKVRDKLVEMCAEAVMIFVCVRVCVRASKHVSRCVQSRLHACLAQKRLHCFHMCVCVFLVIML